MNHSYKVGDKVEIAGYKTEHAMVLTCPPGIKFYDIGCSIESSDIVCWTEVTVRSMDSAGSIFVFWRNPGRDWLVEYYDVDRFIRPININVQAQIITADMATSCINCHEGFMYPVEHNVKGGRLCFSCNSTSRWKYTS